LTQHGKPASRRHRPHDQRTLAARPQGVQELIDHPGLAAAVAFSEPAIESRPLPHVPSERAPRDSPAAGPQENVPRPRHLAWWERILIGALTLAFAALIIGWLFGTRMIHGSAHVAAVGPTWAHYIPWRPAIYVVWLVPLGELGLMLLGKVHYQLRFRRAPRGLFRLLLIQITTTGNEAVRVNEIIAQMRGYDLRMPLQIWVVTEPWGAVTAQAGYPGADRVIVVPEAFTARSERKARALEFSRQVRGLLGLDTADVKILFNDDDVTPTENYIKTAFAALYDVCEGVTVPRVHYSTGPLAHFFASHVDDTRTRGCLTYCSVFQGIIGKPLWVHGEGLTATGEAERIVTWDWPVFASEDLTFGQNAAKMGLRWGWFHDYVELTSPWGVKDFFTQRKRWTWGNIHAISHRDVLPLSRAIPLAAKYALDASIVVLSVVGISLRFAGYLPPGSPVYDVSKLAILSWMLMFFYCGWVAAEHKPTSDSRLLHATIAALLSPVSSILAFLVLVITVIQGNPRTFEVIRKTRETAS
jgi:Glycosyl transferase family group 2